MQHKLIRWFLGVTVLIATVYQFATGESDDIIFMLSQILFIISLIPLFNIGDRQKPIGLIAGCVLMPGSYSVFNLIFSDNLIFTNSIYFIGVCAFSYGLFQLLKHHKLKYLIWPVFVILLIPAVNGIIPLFDWDYYQFEYFFWSTNILLALALLPHFVTNWTPKDYFYLSIFIALQVLRLCWLIKLDHVEEWHYSFGYDFETCTACDLLESFVVYVKYTFLIIILGAIITIEATKALSKRAIQFLLLIIFLIITFIFLWDSHLDERNNQKLLRYDDLLKQEIKRAESLAYDARECEAAHLVQKDQFDRFLEDMFSNKWPKYALYDVIEINNTFKLIRKDSPSVGTIYETMMLLNAEYNFRPRITSYWNTGDSIRLNIDRSKFSRTKDVEIYKAKVVLSFTELEAINYVMVFDQWFRKEDFTKHWKTE